MSSTQVTTSASLVEAISFLTRPLSLTCPPLTINLLQQILLSTLANLPTWLRNSRMTLTFSSAAPPRPIYAACIATNLDWTEWFYALGGREFDLTVERTLVTLHFTGSPERIAIWKQGPAIRPIMSVTEPEPKVQVPISKFSQSVRLNKTPSHMTIDSALTRTQSKTLAQQLLQSEHEKEEADEIFAMISNLNACLISPTPTHERFNIPSTTQALLPPRFSTLEEEIFHAESSFRKTIHTPSPVSSPDSSRPSSPSSTFSSYSSSQESLTSISTTSSPIENPTIKPFVLTKRQPLAPTATTRRTQPAAPAAAPQVIIDTTKKQVQRYLYQGGQSTVLTGGVMLGGGAAAAKPSPISPPTIPKYRAPVGGRKPASGLVQNKSQQTRSTGGGLWRRAAAASRV